MQNLEFQYRLRVMKFRDCDIVLGVDWLSQFNPVLFDFIEGSITLTYESTKMEFYNEVIKDEFKTMIDNGKKCWFKNQMYG